MTCVNCGRAATKSVVLGVSTLGTKPRIQRFSEVLKVCDSCCTAFTPAIDKKRLLTGFCARLRALVDAINDEIRLPAQLDREVERRMEHAR